MPKILPQDFEIRECVTADLPGIANVMANAPDDGTAWRYDINSPLYKPYIMTRAIGFYRGVLCDPNTLIRVAVVGGQVIAYSSWTKQELRANGKVFTKPWRQRTWLDVLNNFLMGLEVDYRNYIQWLHPSEMQADAKRTDAINRARSRDETPPKDQACYELVDIAVLPEIQGYGIGTMLLKWGLDRAADEGIPVYTKGEEQGLRFYDHHGFSRIGETEYWIGDDGIEISRDEVIRGNARWRKENGGVNGAGAVWWPQADAIRESELSM